MILSRSDKGFPPFSLLGLNRDDVSGQAQDIILGQMRLVIATLAIEEITAHSAICKVKRGGKTLKKLLEEGKKIKCGIKDFYRIADGYGF